MPDVAVIDPFAPLAMVIAGLWLFGSLYPSRSGVVAVTAVACLSYARWRIVDTIPWGGTPREIWWPLVCLGIELAAMFDAAILLAVLARPTNRSAEADAGEAHWRRLWAQDPAAMPAVDVFIATYNEPIEVLEKTIIGCLALEWPKARIWVLDDGRRAWVRDYALSKGAGYITRPDNQGAKAGNINHGLLHTQAPFVAVFDADFVPQHDFLLRTMGFFSDAKVGIVQVPHSFYNRDPMQTNLGLEDAIPDDQRFFFEAIMPGRDGWDAAFCCGSNSVTRRKVFEDVGGGLPEGSITEDMLLTLASLRKGYITRYLNEPLAFGLAPESTAAFFVQRQRWAQGAIQILYLKEGPLGPRLRLKYRLLFLPSAWIFQGLACMYTLVGPLMFALFNLAPMVAVDLPGIVFYVLPMMVALVGGIGCLAPANYVPLPAQILAIFQAFRILPVALQTLVKPRGLIFKVTPKGSNTATGGWELRVFSASLLVMAASALAIGINLKSDDRIVAPDSLMPVVAFWLTFNILMLFFVAMMCLEKPRHRSEERFALKHPVTIIGQDGAMLTSDCGNISLSGLGLIVDSTAGFSDGDRVQIVLPQLGIVRGFVRRTGHTLGIAFDFHSPEIRDRLIVWLFTNPIDINRRSISTLQASIKLLRRLWSADLGIHQNDETPPLLVASHTRLAPETLVIAPQSGPIVQSGMTPTGGAHGLGPDAKRALRKRAV